MHGSAWCVLTLAAAALGPGTVLGQGRMELARGGPQPHFVAAWAPDKEREAERSAVLAGRVSLELQDVSLDEALKALTNEAGLQITYSEAILPRGKRVTIKAGDIAVITALTEMLFRSGLDVVVDQDGTLALVPCKHLVPRAEVQDSGTIVGSVTDKATGAPLAGATVIVEGTSRSASTDNTGHYRITEVAPGTYTVRARYIGYAVLSTPVTVATGEEVTADFGLVKSVQKLDELVTVTPGGLQTEAKALSSPVTVITAEDIEAQRPQTINQVFRELVPSAVGFTLPVEPVQTGLSVRGKSSISGGSNLKIFLDGVEMSAAGLSPVDPSSIERIEVVRGPQASTLYGPDAAGGVLQIFTKRGAGPAQIDLRAQSGVLQTPYPGSRSALRQEYNASLTGGGSDVNYNVGGSYTHLDDWLSWPAPTAQSIPSVFGGVRYAHGIVTFDLSSRYQRSVLRPEANPDLQSTGFIGFSRPSFTHNVFENQTASARVGVTPAQWWDTQLTVGIDRSTLDQRQTERRLTSPADTLFGLFGSRNSKISLQLNSAFTRGLSPDVTGSLIAGVDYYRADQDQESVFGVLNTSGTIVMPPGTFISLSSDLITNTGYFAQAQVGWRETLFLTGGIRADDNSTFGADLGAPVQPRIGLSVVLQPASVTVKLRGAYGRAIRAPGIGLANGAVGPAATQLANPLLQPERQRGWDAGADLIFGSRGSLSLTWYDQIADDLIVRVVTAASPLTFQFQNLGRVSNSGLEVEGTLNLNPLQVRAQYAYTDSRVDDLGGAEGTGLTVGGRPSQSPAHTAGATLTATPWRTGTVSAGFTYVGGYRGLDFIAFGRCLGGTGPCPTPFIFSNFQRDYPGFTKASLNVTQRITSQVDGFLSVDNLTNNTAFEGGNLLAVMGRTTMVGLHARF